MKREKQIEKAAERYIKGIVTPLPASIKAAFIAGAIYVDENPNLYSVTRKAVEREREYLIRVACDWLREVHYICITIYPDNEKGFEAVFYDIESDVEITLQSFGIYDFHIFGNSYEEAVEAAIKYSLENLV